MVVVNVVTKPAGVVHTRIHAYENGCSNDQKSNVFSFVVIISPTLVVCRLGPFRGLVLMSTWVSSTHSALYVASTKIPLFFFLIIHHSYRHLATPCRLLGLACDHTFGFSASIFECLTCHPHRHILYCIYFALMRPVFWSFLLRFTSSQSSIVNHALTRILHFVNATLSSRDNCTLPWLLQLIDFPN